jgi:type IV pilus assembly protein PilE
MLAMSSRPSRLHPAAARRGFTLIEVMIVVAIIAIIAAVALPSYFDSVRKARRADAYNAITKAQQAQERFRANNSAYGPLFVNVSLATFAAAASGAVGGVDSFDSSDGYYIVKIKNASTDAANYTIQAFARAGSSQVKDKNCQCLELRATGGSISYAAGGTTAPSAGTDAACAGAATGASANLCWRR